MNEEKCKCCKYYLWGKCDFILDIYMDGIPVSRLGKCPKDK